MWAIPANTSCAVAENRISIRDQIKPINKEELNREEGRIVGKILAVAMVFLIVGAMLAGLPRIGSA